jgi:hypothetical protein
VVTQRGPDISDETQTECLPVHSLSYCLQSLRLVCSSSHELLILGISVMQWFPLALCMIVFIHTVGLLWTSHQPVAETSTCTGQHNIETQETNIHAISGIRTRDPSNQAAADLRLRPRGYRGRLPVHYALIFNNQISGSKTFVVIRYC